MVFRTVLDDSILKSKISNFNWPGLGHRRGRPPFRPVGADRRSEAGPSPGQLKFEFLSPTSGPIFEKDFSKELVMRHEDTMQAERSSTSDADNRKAKRFGFR